VWAITRRVALDAAHREPNVTTNPQPPRIKRRTVGTEGQITNLKLGATSH